jgi:serine/threonine protein kinase
MSLTRLGDYDLIEVLAHGESGVVYRAKGRGVASLAVCVKQLSDSLCGDRALLARLAAEARIVRGFDHDNVVGFLSIGNDAGVTFLVTELVDGATVESYRDRIVGEGRPASAGVVAGIALSICRALAYIHDFKEFDRPLNLIHRSVAPSKVLFGRDGTVKLLDVGLARAAASDHRGRRRAYQAPEQISGEGLDRRGDLYSVGIIMYELLCGRRLFADEGDRDLKSPVPPPSTVFGGFVDPALERICLRALDSDKARRFPNAEAMLEELEAWSTERFSVQVPPELAGEVVAFVALTADPTTSVNALTPDFEAPSARLFPVLEPVDSALSAGVSPLFGASPESLVEEDEPTVFTSALAHDERPVSQDWLPFHSDELDAIEKVEEAVQRAQRTELEQRNMRAEPPPSIDVEFALQSGELTPLMRRPRHGDPMPFTPDVGSQIEDDPLGDNDAFADLGSLADFDGFDEHELAKPTRDRGDQGAPPMAVADDARPTEKLLTVPAPSRRPPPAQPLLGTRPTAPSVPTPAPTERRLLLLLVSVAVVIALGAVGTFAMLAMSGTDGDEGGGSAPLLDGESAGDGDLGEEGQGGDELDDSDSGGVFEEEQAGLDDEDDAPGLPWRKRGQALLVLKARPQAVAYLNGKLQGKTPLWVVVNPGTHQVTFKRPKSKTVSRKIVLRKGQKRIFSHRF